jgi:hypothetical protein
MNKTALCSILVITVSTAFAQDPGPPPPLQLAGPQVPDGPQVLVVGGLKAGTAQRDGFFYREVMRGGEFVKGAPYTATAVTETTQVLSDGNRIVNKSTALLARDNEGRTRREETLSTFGPLRTQATKLVFINDPTAKVEYVLNMEEKTASVHKLDGAKVLNFEQKRIAGKPIQASEQPDVKQEALPNEDVDGVSCEHVLQTETIPAGSIGNERTIVATQETCASPELHLLLIRKRNDPRFGETAYKLTDIKRGEPDPSLFQVPGDFKIVDDKLPLALPHRGR